MVESMDNNDSFPLVIDLGKKAGEFAMGELPAVEAIEGNLLRYGSVLFRNTGVNTVSSFEIFAQALCSNLYSDYGDLPPSGHSQKVYGATPYEPQSIIHFHNEASHTAVWPTRQFFYTEKAASQGGELRVVDGRRVVKALDSEIVDMFIEKGLMYVRNYIPRLDVSWKDFFKVNDKKALEKKCEDNKIEYEWKGETFSTRQRAPAVILHPETNEPVWFNQIQLHHPRMLDEEVCSTLISIYGEHGLPRNVLFGDGTPIPPRVIRRISEKLDEYAVSIASKNGDIVYNDNLSVAHSRLAYMGERKVYVALGKKVSQSDVSSNPQRLKWALREKVESEPLV